MESETGIPVKKQRLLIKKSLLQNAKVVECIREFELPQTFPSMKNYKKLLGNNMTIKHIAIPTSMASSITLPKRSNTLIADTKLLNKLHKLKLKSADGQHLGEFDIQLLSQINNNINNTVPMNEAIVNIIPDLDRSKSNMPIMKISPDNITDATKIVNNSLTSLMHHSKSNTSLILSANQEKPTHKVLIQPLKSDGRTNANVNQYQMQSTSNNLEGNNMYIVQSANNWKIVQLAENEKQNVSTTKSTPKLMKFPHNNGIKINSLKVLPENTNNIKNPEMIKSSSLNVVKNPRLQRQKLKMEITDKSKQSIIDGTNDVGTARMFGIKRPLNISSTTNSFVEADEQSSKQMDNNSSVINAENSNGNNDLERNIVSSTVSHEINSKFNFDDKYNTEKNIITSKRSYPLRNSHGTVNLIRRGKKELTTNANKSISNKINTNSMTTSKQLTTSTNLLTNLQNNKNEDNLSNKDVSNKLSIVGQALSTISNDELRTKALQALADCGIGVECFVPVKPPLDKMSIKESQTQTCVFGLLDQNNFLRVSGDTNHLSRLKVIDRHNIDNTNISNTSIQESQKFTKKLNKILNQRWVNKDNVEQIKEILKVNPIVEKTLNLMEKDFKSAKKYDKNGLLNIHRAILSDQSFVVKRQLMVLRGCKQSIDLPTSKRETGLELAIKYSISPGIINMLLKSGANPISHESAHDSALTIAANKSSYFLSELIKYVSSSDDLNYHDSQGMTALHHCVLNENMAGLLALINANADVNIRDLKSGRTPLFHALQNEYLEIAAELLKNGAKANIPNFSGQTAIAKNLLEKAALDFTKENKYSILLQLYSVFGGVFERALELYDSGKVTKIISREANATGIWKEIDASRWLIEVKGSGEAYILFPNINYCPCAAFRFQVLRDQSDLTCKHILAAWLFCLNSEKIQHRHITRIQFKNLLSIVQLLRSINFKECATCFCSENGLKVTVEDSKCLQANAYIPINVFREFNLAEDVVFKINLNVLVECLGMFWSSMTSPTASVGLQLNYKDVGYPVTVWIEEDGVITDCSLKTQEPDELLDFRMESDSILNKVILHTELLRDILSELDPTTEFIQLLLSPNAPYFRISTEGLAGECRIELPHDSELIDTFQCKAEATFCYQYSHIKPATKALSCANKVSLKTDKDGLLCFQYMVKAEEGHMCYIEYYVSC
ncbi:hypothetical protein PV325_013369 [Microctonus aethiopoides]|nr:hypothetical protein PV325_013369 [Microctonus aethiopoides]